ncbi:MAG: asparagine synthase (glutamine-hydrolyzing) [Desulfarculus sp.]|nr:asparagine synthase (glutamine-hydrolyzing) [Desulfarculus sp.]
MCGIAGIVSQAGALSPERLRSLALAMSQALRHRGPDDAGAWLDPTGRCALVHRRLSIIDLRPEGRQPLVNETGRAAVTFNGEIYNFQDLRRRLLGRGHRFVSQTDGEVLVHLLEDLPAQEVVASLEGMFAFAHWDSETRSLLLARDRFGKKPLYHAQGPGWFAFSSELRPLTLLPGFDDSLTRDSVAGFLMLQYAHAPGTIFRGARKLEPGSLLVLGPDQEPQTRHWWRYRPHDLLPPSLSPDRLPFVSPNRRPWNRLWQGLRRRVLPHRQAPAASTGLSPQRVEELRGLLIGAVERRLIADVPLGAFLSGGVDSSLVVAIMTRELGVKADTFSIGFAGSSQSEHEHARQMAEHLGCNHHEQVLAPDVMTLLAEVTRALDEPNGDTSCLPTYLLCRHARGHVTVALSGDGADELFCGYPRYFATLEQSLARDGLTPAQFYLTYSGPLVVAPDSLAKLLGGLPPAQEDTLAAWNALLQNRRAPLVDRLRCLDADTYLPGAVLAKVDRMSMHFALEVRCPFLDGAVARFAAGLTPDECYQRPRQGKVILKELGAKYFPGAWLHRPKTGFGIPADFWRPNQLTALARDMLLGGDSHLGPWLEVKPLLDFLRRLERTPASAVYQLWPFLILESWLRDQADWRPRALAEGPAPR